MNRIVAKLFPVAAASLCVFLGSAVALASPATSRAQTQNTRHANASSDELFVRTAAESSMSEVDLGKLAEQKSQDAQVKKFAQLMVEEHGKITEQLKQLGMSERIDLPTSVSRKDAAAHRELRTSSGAGFDKAYAQQVTTELEQQTAEFKRAASSATKPAVKEFAERTTPTLESELQEAKQLAHAR